jgi:non-homologous end joining protein Ku
MRIGTGAAIAEFSHECHRDQEQFMPRAYWSANWCNVEAPEAEQKPSNVINLMNALRESVRADRHGGHPRTRKRKTRRR